MEIAAFCSKGIFWDRPSKRAPTSVPPKIPRIRLEGNSRLRRMLFYHRMPRRSRPIQPLFTIFPSLVKGSMTSTLWWAIQKAQKGCHENCFQTIELTVKRRPHAQTPSLLVAQDQFFVFWDSESADKSVFSAYRPNWLK